MEKEAEENDVLNSYMNSPPVPQSQELTVKSKYAKRRGCKEKSISFCNNRMKKTLNLLSLDCKNDISTKNKETKAKKLKSEKKKSIEISHQKNGIHTARANALKNSNIAKSNYKIDINQINMNDQILDYTPIVIPFQINDSPI